MLTRRAFFLSLASAAAKAVAAGAALSLPVGFPKETVAPKQIRIILKWETPDGLQADLPHEWKWLAP